MEEQTGSEGEKKGLAALDERVRLTRFFTKLLEESLQFGCDTLEFILESNRMMVNLVKGAATVKSVPLKAQWYEPINNWLSQHSAAILNPSHPSFKEYSKVEYSAAVKITNGIVTFQVNTQVTKTEKKLRCKALSIASFKDFYDLYPLNQFSKLALEQISVNKVGLILVSAPNNENLNRSVNSILNITQAVYISDLDWAQDPKNVLAASETELIVHGIKSQDAIEAIWRLKELGYELDKLNLIGSICQGFCPRVCRACAKESVIDAALTKALPHQLKPKPGASYLVGRGCEQCNNSSYKGYVAIQNIISIDEYGKKLLATESDIKNFTKHYYGQGLRSLLEDGLSKAWSGLVCLEPLYKLVQVLPEAYQKVSSSITFKGDKVDPIQVRGDFFTESSEQSSNIGQGHFFRGAISNDGDSSAPLFSVTKTGKVRDKSLILVVEDDPDQREILDMVFRSANFQVQVATDGVDAMGKIKTDMPDLIVTDLMMPKMDGLQLIRQLKANPKHQKIPVLVLTVISDADKEYELLDVGADDYCEKTIQRKLLLKRAQKILNRS